MARLNGKQIAALLIAVSLVGCTFGGGGQPSPTAEGQTNPEEPAQQEQTPTANGQAPAGQTEGQSPTPTSEGPTATPGGPTTTPSGDTPVSPAYLRVLHAAGGAPEVDVLVDGRMLRSDTSFEEMTLYTKMVPGEHTITITEAGNRQNVLYEESVNVKPGATTFAATGTSSGNMSDIQVKQFTDNPERPANDSAAVNLVHLSPNAPKVDVTTQDGTVIADDVAFGNASAYTTIPAGDYRLQIRAATPNNDGLIISTQNVSVSGGAAYSFMAMGYVNPSSGQEGFDVVRYDSAHLLKNDGQAIVQLPREIGDNTWIEGGYSTPSGDNTSSDESTSTPTEEETPTETPTEEETPTETPTEEETPTESSSSEGETPTA